MAVEARSETVNLCATMKIVNLDEFRNLPAGTIAAKYEPCYFDPLFAKGDTLESDFLLEYLTSDIDCTDSEDFADKLYASEELGVSVKMDFNSTMRDGCYNEQQLFAVWEKEDVMGLIEKLKQCLESYQ